MRIKAKEAPSEESAQNPEQLDAPCEPVEEDFGNDPEAPETKPKNQLETFKKIIWVCLVNGILWIWCSYILAWFGREQIAESLSGKAVIEIVGVAFVYAIKSLVENLSKNNKWPDKHDDNSSSEGLG